MSDAPSSNPRARSAPNTDEGSVLSTLHHDGRRRWITPRLSPGHWLTRRRIVAYLLIAIFAAIPHITIAGKHILLLDLTTRRFTILTRTFLPTDTLLLALLLLGAFFSIFLFTALLGRVWCGWACPQTVYLEFVFRPIQRLFEGGPGRPAPAWLQRTGLGKPLKLLTYLLVSLFLAHTFLAYFVPWDTIVTWMSRSPFEHPTPFLVVAVTTGLMLFDFGYFREQTCLVACPYGRMQSTLLDRASLIVSYDPKRGEPRGKRVSLPVAGNPAPQGDCVDCGLCVATCPTGIDIRNGLQMECVQCTQCIDACDAVMTKLHKPTGLIRYASQAEIGGSPRRFLRPRTIVYPVILTLIATAFVTILIRQPDANVSVLRARGAVYTTVSPSEVGNQVQVKIINRRPEKASFRISSPESDLSVRAEINPVELEPAGMLAVPVLLVVPSGSFTHGKRQVTLTVTREGGEPITRTFTLAGPETSSPQGGTP